MAISLKLSFYIFFSAGVGANLRWLLSYYINKNTDRIWLGTLAVNLIGCLLLFMITRYQPSDRELDTIIKTGLIGSLTTFSALSFEAVTLLKNGRVTEAVLMVLLNVFFGIAIGIGVFR